MDRTSPAMQRLARRLLAVEAARGQPARGEAIPSAQAAAVRVAEKLRIALTKFAGPAGFGALLSCALTMAKADVPGGALQTVTIGPDGTLQGFAEIADDDGAILLIAHLLGLLVTFIGEPIALRLVRAAWPDEALEILQLELRS